MIKYFSIFVRYLGIMILNIMNIFIDNFEFATACTIKNDWLSNYMNVAWNWKQ